MGLVSRFVLVFAKYGICEDTGCCPEDLPRAMNDREEWRERIRDIRATSTMMMMMMVLYRFISSSQHLRVWFSVISMLLVYPA